MGPIGAGGIVGGRIGTPQRLRSLTRDPSIPDLARVPPSTIFLETLIHDFDAPRYVYPGAHAVDVYAVADALACPAFREQGLQDTAVAVVRFDNGAIATDEASFNAVYVCDVQGEAFGSNGRSARSSRVGPARLDELDPANPAQRFAPYEDT